MDDSKAGPVEVWLAQRNMAINCTVVHEDEHTDSLDVDSLSMRGAQREITGYLIDQGYKPGCRWTTTATDYSATPGGDPIETYRRFQVATR